MSRKQVFWAGVAVCCTAALFGIEMSAMALAPENGATAGGATLQLAAKPPEQPTRRNKTEICRKIEFGQYELVEIPLSRLPHHVRQGAGVPGGPVPTRAAFEFGDGCEALFIGRNDSYSACVASAKPCSDLVLTSDKSWTVCKVAFSTSANNCLLDLAEVIDQINGDATLQGEGIMVTDDSPMAIELWGAKGRPGTGTPAGTGGDGGYARTVTTVNDYAKANGQSTDLYFYIGERGPRTGLGDSCGGWGGTSSLVLNKDLNGTPFTDPVVADAVLVAGAAGGGGGNNQEGFCGDASPTDGGHGGTAIAELNNAVNGAGSNNCGGGDGGAGGTGCTVSDGAGKKGTDGVGGVSGRGGLGSACTFSSGTVPLWVNGFLAFSSGAGGDGNSDSNACTSGGGGGGGGYGGGGGGGHGNEFDHASGGGGGSRAIGSTVDVTPPQDGRFCPDSDDGCMQIMVKN